MNPHSPLPVSGRRRRPVDAWLHRMYFRGSGFRFFIGRRCRPATIAVGVVLLLATCLGMAHDSTSVYQLFSLSLGMVVIGLTWAMCRRAAVEAKRELPRFGTAGEPLRYSVRVWHDGKRRLTRAWLADSPPDPRPSLADFSLLREPGEEARNGVDRRTCPRNDGAAYHRFRLAGKTVCAFSFMTALYYKRRLTLRPPTAERPRT